MSFGEIWNSFSELNNREVAYAIWIAIGFFWVINMTQLHERLSDLVWAFFNFKILLSIAAIIAYVALSAWLLSIVGIWDWSQLKSTVVWGTTFAFLTMVDVATKSQNPKRLKVIAAETVGATTFVVFVAELHSFALWIELLLVPFLGLVAILATVADRMPKAKGVAGFFQGLLVIAGVAFLANGTIYATRNFSSVVSWETLQGFVVPIALSLIYLPFLYLILLYVSLEQAAIGLRFRFKNNGLRRYAIARAILELRGNIELFRRFKRSLQMEDKLDRDSIERVLAEIRRTAKRERNPEHVSPEHGWSPFAAKQFLASEGFETKDYHRFVDEWVADSDPIEIGEGVLPCRISYCVYGTEAIATRLTLSLNADDWGNIPLAEERFWVLCRKLLQECGAEGAASAFEKPQTLDGEGEIRTNLLTISLTRDDWLNHARGGYTRTLTIRHAAHIPTING